MGIVGADKLPFLVGVKPAVKTLYFWGNWDDDFWGRTVTVVGSRRMTEYGRGATEKLVAELVAADKIIVSGFMYGVDRLAHRSAIKFGGKTVAVLGWGIEYKMDSEQEKLAEEILQSGGLIISEWKDEPGQLWTFPYRDRILAAMGKETYVVEAAAKSGTMITVSWAKKLGRPVWAVPGPVTGLLSEGTNGLIARGEARAWLPGATKRSTNNSDVYSLLQCEALTTDEIVRKIGKPVEVVSAELTMLMLKGQVVERGGKYYVCG
jgi:DNA processing protein